MALDSDRVIKTLSLDPFQSEFQKVINDVEKNLVLALGSQLHLFFALPPLPKREGRMCNGQQIL